MGEGDGAGNLALAVGTALLLYHLAGLLGLREPWAVAAAALLLCSPIFIFQITLGMSDVAAVFWCLAAVYAAWRGRCSGRWALVAGAALAVAVLVRPTNLPLGLPVVIALGLRWRAWLQAAAGGLPAAVFLIWYNSAIYEAAVAIGYGDVRSLLG